MPLFMLLIYRYLNLLSSSREENIIFEKIVTSKVITTVVSEIATDVRL